MQRAVLILLFAALPAWGFDANGVLIGVDEVAVHKSFPSARCRELEWKSKAAERRCDDAKIAFAGGVQARITFYLGRNAVQAFDVRFDERDLERVVAFLKQRYGKPMSETREKIERGSGEAREIYKVRWEKAQQRAVLTAQLKKKRVDLSVWQGNFDEEIYRVR
jgi:ATP-dependent RNA circularization protein (DNA/RNA ligase family)